MYKYQIVNFYNGKVLTDSVSLNVAISTLHACLVAPYNDDWDLYLYLRAIEVTV